MAIGPRAMVLSNPYLTRALRVPRCVAIPVRYPIHLHPNGSDKRLAAIPAPTSPVGFVAWGNCMRGGW
jgi:hypothetical protein